MVQAIGLRAWLRVRASLPTCLRLSFLFSKDVYHLRRHILQSQVLRPPTHTSRLSLIHFATPRYYYGGLLENNGDPVNVLARAERAGEKGAAPPERLVKITRLKAAAANLAECMPVYLAASLIAWLAGVRPEHQNAYHIVWLASRIAYKWAYLQGKGMLRTMFFNMSMIPTVTMLIHSGNMLASQF
ncbi:hypothetical protein PQX77_016364 [Marasmius sp. AFHP31]|nr:hypothetical protein PQX77_016364 [Marasmius sp. AFHP31]